MNILWLTNVKLPEIYQIQSQRNRTYVGGWLSGLYNGIITDNNVEKIMICYPQSGEQEKGSKDKTSFCSFDKNDVGNLQDYFIKIINEFGPDVIHIHGTEFEYAYIMVKAATYCQLAQKIVCSIQGLVSVYAKHFYAGIPEKVFRKKTVIERIKKTGLEALKDSYEKRGEKEIKLIREVYNIVGRTTWDKACINLINPNARYFHCNEILRKEFYCGNWNYDSCEKHSVFLSQGAKPIKGLHMAIRALGIVKRYYPDVVAYVAGDNILDNKIGIHQSTYASYISELIDENKLVGNIIFTGPLTAEQMKDKMLRSNVFVLPSSIENSPNSLGEAMLLGVPCIASDVGGVVDMITPGVEGYVYPFDEYYKLAYYLIDVFSKEERIRDMSEAASERAKITHDTYVNSREMLSIYTEVAKGE